MAATYTAVVQRHGDWWIGWVEEVPGVNSQGTTREELLDNLRDALEEALEMNRADARAAAAGAYEEVSLMGLDRTPPRYQRGDLVRTRVGIKGDRVVRTAVVSRVRLLGWHGTRAEWLYYLEGNSRRRH